MKNVLVVAPHADDETLGCAGTIFWHRQRGDEVSWLIVTGMTEAMGFTPTQMATRTAEIRRVEEFFGFSRTIEAGFPAAALETVPRAEVVGKIAQAMAELRPEVLYLPFPGDVHSDHRATFEAVAACTKWFRYPCVREVLAYHVVSETDIALDPTQRPFTPTVFVDIAPFLEKKIEAMAIYASEFRSFPFPRSADNLRSHARYLGSLIGSQAAEGFQLLKEIRA